MQMHMFFPENDSDSLISNQGLLAQNLWKRLNPHSWPIRITDLPAGTALVGGSIRDGLLDRLSQKPDLDFVVKDKAIELVQYLAKKINGTCVVLDQERDIARLVVDGWSLDFARQVGRSLEDDLRRRDFRLNAIGLTFHAGPKLLDPTGGIEDLRGKIIVSIHKKNLIEDPLRLLRAFRLMAELNFSLEANTQNSIISQAHLLRNVACERIKTEILKIVRSKFADSVLPILKKSLLLETWQSYDKFALDLPSIIALKDFNSDELLIALPLARLISLLSQKGLSELSFSKNHINRCRVLRLWQHQYDGLAFKTLSEDARLQLHSDLEKDLPALILLLPESDRKTWLTRWRDLSDPLFHPSCPIDGFTLQQTFNIAPGPSLGQLMQYLSKEKAFGRVCSNSQAFDVARYWKQQNMPFL